MLDLAADPDWALLLEEIQTGIYVRAKRGEKWDSVDIAELSPESLLEWLRSRGGENEWAEGTVFALLGHGDETFGETLAKRKAQ